MEAGQEDFPRTRLTHSLEVAQVGRELGSALGCDPDLVDTACLSHDLGHPPFGHNGETALNELAKDIGGFEGNAQSFRLLTRLEPKAFDVAAGPRAGQSIGLNLTRAALDAASKYPWTKRDGQIKFGVYDDDADVFNWARNGRTDDTTCFEAQVMDWSDDVSYSVHDIEDAVFAGHVNIDILKSKTGRSEIVEVAQIWYGHEFATELLDEALIRISSLPSWPKSFDGTMTSLASLKNLTSTLIGRFCLAAQKATQAKFGTEPLTRYSANLEVPDDARYEVTALKALAARYVMNRDGAAQMYARQRQQIHDLVGTISLDPMAGLDRFHKELWVNANSSQTKARVVIDQIAALTDVSLVQWHTRLGT
jgi:dGTPase